MLLDRIVRLDFFRGIQLTERSQRQIMEWLDSYKINYVLCDDFKQDRCIYTNGLGIDILISLKRMIDFVLIKLK